MSMQIKRWKWNWVGHTLRKGNESIERESLDWNLQGKRRSRRPRHMWWRTVHNETLEKGKNWNEFKRMARNRTRWRCFVDVLCPLRDNRNWWWWWWLIMAIFSVNAGSSMSYEVIVLQHYLVWDVCRSFGLSHPLIIPACCGITQCYLHSNTRLFTNNTSCLGFLPS